MGTTIRYTVQAGDILGFDARAREGLDEMASARAYAAMLETELGTAYPDAEIDVTVARTSGGREIAVTSVDDDGDEIDSDPIAQRVREIAGRLWEKRMDEWTRATE
jgi:hypothetical protein